MSSQAFSLVVICMIFFGIGWGNAAMGPLLEAFAANTGLPLAQAGLIFTVSFSGGVVANLAGGPASDRLGRGPILLASVLFGCAAMVGATLCRSLPLLLALMFLTGLAGSAMILCASALVTDLFAERSVAALNLSTLFFGIGAFVGPGLVSVSMSLWKTGMPSLWLSAAIGLAVEAPLIAAVTRRMTREAIPHSAPSSPASGGAASPAPSQTEPPGASRAPFSFLLSPLLWVFGAILLFDVGTEQTIAAWTTVYMSVSTTLAIEKAALVVSGFWVAFTLGRLGAAGIGSRWSSHAILGASLATAGAGILLVNLGSGRVLPSILGFLLAGLGFGPLFPTVVALVGLSFGRNAGAAMGITMTLGTAGGMFMVWFEGTLIAANSPTAGVRLFAFTLLAIAALAASARFLMRRAASGGSLPR